jgi:hypothetical protein
MFDEIEEQIEEQEEQTEQQQDEQEEIVQTNKGGRPKSIIWGTYIKQGKQISKGQIEIPLLFSIYFHNNPNSI